MPLCDTVGPGSPCGGPPGLFPGACNRRAGRVFAPRPGEGPGTGRPGYRAWRREALVVVVIRAVVFDIGGVLEITPDLGVDRMWETRLGRK